MACLGPGASPTKLVISQLRSGGRGRPLRQDLRVRRDGCLSPRSAPFTSEKPAGCGLGSTAIAGRSKPAAERGLPLSSARVSPSSRTQKLYCYARPQSQAWRHGGSAGAGRTQSRPAHPLEADERDRPFTRAGFVVVVPGVHIKHQRPRPLTFGRVADSSVARTVCRCPCRPALRLSGWRAGCDTTPGSSCCRSSTPPR